MKEVSISPTPPVVAIHCEQLTAEEQREREQCENQITQGAEMVAAGLATIHSKKLYRDTHRNFADYVRDTFEKTERWARYQIASFETVNAMAAQLSDGDELGTIVPKLNQSATRQLRGLDTFEQIAVVRSASDNGTRTPKAADIKQARQASEARSTQPEPEQRGNCKWQTWITQAENFKLRIESALRCIDDHKHVLGQKKHADALSAFRTIHAAVRDWIGQLTEWSK